MEEFCLLFYIRRSLPALASASVRAFSAALVSTSRSVVSSKSSSCTDSLSACSGDRVDGVCQALGVLIPLPVQSACWPYQSWSSLQYSALLRSVSYLISARDSSSALAEYTEFFEHFHCFSVLPVPEWHSTMELMFGSPLLSASSTHSSE